RVSSPIFPCDSLIILFHSYCPHRALHSFPTRRSSDLALSRELHQLGVDVADAGHVCLDDLHAAQILQPLEDLEAALAAVAAQRRSEEHTSELQSLRHLVCRLLLEKKKVIT